MNLNAGSILKIVGTVLMIIGLSMSPSVLVSFIYDGYSVSIPFLLTMCISVAVGFILRISFRNPMHALRVSDGFLIVTMCWFISAALGAVPFIVTGSITNFTDAFFESCSGFSTTGSSILTDIEALPRGILFWRSFTHWIGGMGILIFAIALMPSLGISGQNIAVSESPGPSLDKITPKMTDTAKTLYIIYTIFTVAETILLMLGGLSLYDALIQTFGTVGTGGFSNYNDSIAHFDSTYVRMVITAFMFLCGINFNLYFLSFKRGPKLFTRDSEFKLYIGIFFAASFFIFIMLMIKGSYESLSEAFSDSIFQVASILTTTGYATADYEMWPSVCQTVILLLMFVGGCSSSTGGGIKVIRILVLIKLIRRGISTRLHPNVVETIKLNGKTMSSDTVSAIANHLFLYVAMLFAGAFLISFENQDIMTCFSSVITCLGNIGPGFGSIGPSESFAGFSHFSKYLLSVYMIAGRLELYTFFILLTPNFWHPNR